MTGTGTGAGGGQWRGLFKSLGTRTTLLAAALTILIHSAQSSPINRQVGISENVYITVQNDTYGNEQRVCSIDSVTYEDGESIPTSSPCEHCICRPPGFACTIISCEYRPGCKALKRSNQCCPEYQCECEKDGKIYQNGEKILDNNNPCEVCYCQGGDVICAVIDCYWRSDCQPRYIENRCCPLYDHCPPPSQPGPMRPTQRPLPSTTTGVGTSVAWFNLSSSIFASSSTPFAHLDDSTTTSTTTFSTTPAAVLVPSTTEQQPESSSSSAAPVSISAQENENLLISSQVPEIPAQSQTESSVSVSSTEPSTPVKVEIPVVSSQAPVENEVPAVSTTTSTELPEQKPFDDSPSSQSQAASVSESPAPVVIAQVLPVSTEESITSTASPSVDKISESQPEEPVQVLPSSSEAPALSDSVHGSNTIEKEDAPAQTNTITSEVLIPELPVTQTESSTVEVSSASVISTVVPEVMPTSVQELPTVEGTPLPDLSDAAEVEQLPLHDQSSSVDTSLMESISEKSTTVQATESLETVTASGVLDASPTDTIIQASQSEIINPTLTTPSAVVVEATTLPPTVLADPVHIEQSDADTVTEQNIVKESSADVSSDTSDISSTTADEILPAQDDAEPSVTEKLENTPELTPVIPEVEASTAESIEISKPSHPALYPGLIPTPSNILQPPSKPEEDSQNEISVEDQKPGGNVNVDNVPAPPATELLPPIHEVFIPDTTLAPAEIPAILAQTKPEEEAASPNVNLESHLTQPTELKIESSSPSDKIIQPSSTSEVAPVENSHENEVASVADSEALNDDVTTISSVLNDAVVSESSSPFPVELEVVGDVSSTKHSVSHLPETETEAPVVQDQPAPAVQESNTEIPIVSDYVSHDLVLVSSSTTQTPDLGVEVTNAVPVPGSIAAETSENLTTPQSDSSADGHNENANANVIDSAIAADEPQVSVASTDSSLSDDVTESGVVVKSSAVPQAESAVNVGVTDVNNLQDENTESSPNSESDDLHDPINEHSDGLEVTTPQVLRDVTSQGQSQVQDVENKIVSDAVDSSSSDVTTRQPELEILNDATQSSAGETEQIKDVPSLLDAADQIQSDEPVEGTAATTENSVQSDEPSPIKTQEIVAVEEKPHEVPQSSTTDQDILSDDQGEESEQTTVIISSQKSTEEEVKSEVPQLPSLSDLIVGSKSKLTPVRDSVDVVTVQPENVEEKQNEIQENQSPSISINNDEPVVVTTSATIGSEDVQFDESEIVSQNQIQNQPQPTTVDSVSSHGSEIAQVKEQNDEPEVGTTSQPFQFDATASKVVDAEIQSDGTEQEVVTVRHEQVEKVSLESSESKFRLDPSVFNDADSDSESETSKEQPAQPEVNNLEVLPVTSTTRSEAEQPLNDEEVLTTTTPAPAVDPRTPEIKANAVTDDQIIFDDIPTHSPDQLRSEPLVSTNAPSYDGGLDTATPAADEAESVQTTEITRNNNNNADILHDNTVNIELTTTRTFLGAERADLEFDDEVVTEQPVAQPKPQQDNANNVLVDVSSSQSESDSDSDLAKPTEAVLNDEKAEENEQTTTETTVLLRHHLPGHIHENYNLEEETTKQPQEPTPADIKFKSDNSEEVPASTDASILALSQGQERADLPSEKESETTTVLPSAEKEARDDIDDIVPATTNAADSFDEPVSTALPSDLKTVEVDAQHDENESDSDLPATTTLPLFRDDIEVAETAADDVATTFASVYTREDNSSDLVDNETRINETQGEPLRKIPVPTQNVIIPSELVKRLDPISDDLGDNGLGRSDLSLQSLMKDEASSADETWFWRAMNRIRQLPDFLPTLTRQPRSTAFNSYKPELVKPNKTKKATDSVPKKHIPIGSRFIFW